MVVLRQLEQLHIDAGGQELKQVKQFKYLGVTFDGTFIKETAINERIDQYSINGELMYPLLKDRQTHDKICEGDNLKNDTLTNINIRM